ncbi:CoA transferase (plasmid) [Embleya sp. NBC_00888]|uniref:CaiB/BaiF CoA transferase family protein n=1 Tax=Embleya sp. NBC_00888 TaxID=2975960 RepID=UPI002F907858|nr:CoA transferase [Embleya sp. NBC_00888]
MSPEPGGTDRPPDGGVAELPLAGFLVLDLSMFWAGPFATKHLADLGAEVIKVEGPTRIDHVRTVSVPDRSVAEPYNTSRYFNEYNRNKYGLAIDLQTDAGRRIVQDLAAMSDVVVENFRPGAIERLGLGYEQLRHANPRVIMVSLPAYSGLEPERRLPGYGPNVEQMSGISHLSGYIDGPPQKFGISYGDPVAGLGGAAAVLMALVARERTGVGRRIEVSQRNLLLTFIGDAIVAHQFGAHVERQGNRSPVHAPQGVYPSQGADGTPAEQADSWVAVSVTTDEQWTRLAEAMGRPDLAADARLLDARARRATHDDLDREIAAWTRTMPAATVADKLQTVGVPASPVLTPDDLRDDPQLTARAFLRTVDHATMTPMKLTAPTWHFHGLDVELRAAPGLGEHNRDILRGRLGLSDDYVDELEAQGVIAKEPQQKPGRSRHA